MVPVSVRAEDARGALGNQVAAMMAPLPVGCEDAITRYELIHGAMQHLKGSGQAVGAQVLTELTGFAPPNIMSQAARVMARQRVFNLVVTNVPGPQFALYLQGREMREIFPMVPLAGNQAVGVAIMSYNGKINFGVAGDYDGMADLDDLAGDFGESFAELAEAAGVKLSRDTAAERRFRRNGSRPKGRAREKIGSGSGSSDSPG
jgi:hypothetical protein